MKRAVLALAATLLSGCIHLAGPSIGLHAAPTAAAKPAAPVCPGGLTADLAPAPPLPAAAGFPAPANDAESAAVAAYGAWLHSFAVWARAGWARAGDAKTFCEGH
jgi:hypothetical protein